MTSPQFFFLRRDEFPHSELYSGLTHVWEALARLKTYIRDAIKKSGAPEAEPGDLKGLRLEDGLAASEGLFVAKRTVVIPGLEILIEKGTRIEPCVVVKGPTLLCAGCELRHGAYLRGSCLIGPTAVVGHATEVKNSVFMNHAEAGHFAYVGDSILGADANLGAGTKLANLQLRTEPEKRKKAVRTIRIRVGGKPVDTGLRKLGAVVGDDVEIGCNTVTSPGALIGPGCWIVPNCTVPKGVYEADRLLKSAAGKPVIGPRPR